MYCKCSVNVLEIFCRYIVNVLRNILKWFSVVRSSIRWPSTATKYLESCCWRYNQLFYHSLLSQIFQENVLHSFKKMYFGQEKFFWNLKKLYFRSHYQIFPWNQARPCLPLAGIKHITLILFLLLQNPFGCPNWRVRFWSRTRDWTQNYKTI